MSSVGPATNSDRHVSIDAVRGFAVLGILLTDGSEAPEYPYAAILLVDRAATDSIDGDACCSYRGHELLPWGGGAFSKAIDDWATYGGYESPIPARAEPAGVLIASLTNRFGSQL